MEHLVEAKLLETLKDVLSPEQYSALQAQIATKQRVALRRQVFDAKNTGDLPGDLVRKEGDTPISDPTANEVYDNLEIVYRFFKDVFGRESVDNLGKTLVASIHNGQKFNNIDKADWLLGATIVAPGFKARALCDVAYPGTANDDPNLGKDPQMGHKKVYVLTEMDNGGVHTNSGIPNRAFVLAASDWRILLGKSWKDLVCHPDRAADRKFRFREMRGRNSFGRTRSLSEGSVNRREGREGPDRCRRAGGCPNDRRLESEAVIQSWAAVRSLVS